MAVWYFGKPEIPLSGLVLSFGALAVPIASTLWFPESSGEYEPLLWLLALVPAFLLAYYRGWIGVALAMLVGMVVLSMVQVAAIVLDIQSNWVLLLAVVAAYIALGLSIGLVSELLHNERARAERLALLDELTRIPNRRLAEIFLEKEFAAAQRGRGLVVVLFDLDHFKGYNDVHGHAVGDAAIRSFVSVLRRHTRKMDLCARWGGEEFIAILSGGHAEGGVIFADRVREAAAGGAGDDPERKPLPPFTVSAGVAQYEPEMTEPAQLVALADQALYRAKAAGRNAVRAHPVTPDRVSA